MPKYLSEVPRTFATYEATKEEQRDALMTQLGLVVDAFAVTEDITNKEMPTAKEAMVAHHCGLLEKIVTICGLSSQIHAVTGGSGFFGLGKADVVMSTELGKSVGLIKQEVPMIKSPFFSMTEHFETMTANEEKVKAAAPVLPEVKTKGKANNQIERQVLARQNVS